MALGESFVQNHLSGHHSVSPGLQGSVIQTGLVFLQYEINKQSLKNGTKNTATSVEERAVQVVVPCWNPSIELCFTPT